MTLVVIIEFQPFSTTLIQVDSTHLHYGISDRSVIDPGSSPGGSKRAYVYRLKLELCSGNASAVSLLLNVTGCVLCRCASEKAVFRPSDEAVFTTLGVNTHLFACEPSELDSLVRNCFIDPLLLKYNAQMLTNVIFYESNELY